MLSVLTLNAYLLDVRLFGRVRVYPAAPEIDSRLAALPDALREADADVVCLQEIFRRPHRDFIGRALAREYPFVAGLEHSGIPLGTGLMVLSRRPIAESRTREYRTAHLEERIAIRMGSLACRIEIPGGRAVRIINTHLAAGGLGGHPEGARGERVRAGQIAELVALACDSEAPTVIAGDLNCGPHSSPGNFQALIGAGFKDAFAEAAGEAAQTAFTWDPARNPLVSGTLNKSLPSQRIDHVLVAPGRDKAPHPLRATAADVVLAENRIATTGGARHPVSDHYGVRVRLESA